MSSILVIVFKPLVVAVLSALLSYLSGADGPTSASVAGAVATMLRSPLQGK